MATRVLELAEQLQVGTHDLLDVCSLIEIPASSRISCLTNEHIQLLRDHYQKKTPTFSVNAKRKPPTSQMNKT